MSPSEEVEPRPPVRSRGLALVGLATLGLATAGAWWWHASRMPGPAFEGAPPAPSDEEQRLAEGLERDVQTLAGEIGERHERRYGALAEARGWIEARLRGHGLDPHRHEYEVGGLPFSNVVADVGGGSPRVVVGAHYDSARGSPGGNDNASGVAALLALAERLAARPAEHPVRLVAFVNEEPPHFGRATMGSRVYADALAAQGELPDAVIVLDSVGFYDDAAGSQRFPSFSHSLAFGDRGDFVAFIGDSRSEELLRRSVSAFRDDARMRSEGVVLSRSTLGAAWSDHASFWRHDVPAVLVTDTAAFRDERYHRETDDGRQIDFVALARVVVGIERAVRSVSAATR